MLITLEQQLAMFPRDRGCHPAVMRIARHVEETVFRKISEREAALSPFSWTSAELVCRQGWRYFPPMTSTRDERYAAEKKRTSVTKRLPPGGCWDAYAFAKGLALFDEAGQWTYCEGYLATDRQIVETAWAHLNGTCIGLSPEKLSVSTLERPFLYTYCGAYPASWALVGAEIPRGLIGRCRPEERVLSWYEDHYGDLTDRQGEHW